MIELGSVVRLVLLWLATAGHHAASTPPSDESAVRSFRTEQLLKVSKPEDAGDAVDTAKSQREEDVVHDPWFAHYVGHGMCAFVKVIPCVHISQFELQVNTDGRVTPSQTFADSIALMETISRLKKVHPSLAPSPTYFPVISSSPNPLFIAAALSVILGSRIRKSCYAILGRLYTFTHTTRPEHKLVRTGLYKRVRHPAYVGSVVMRIGMVGVLGSDGGWLRAVVGNGPSSFAEIWTWLFDRNEAWTICATRAGWLMFMGWSIVELSALFLRARREDATLRARFGREWEDYAKEVPRMFVPHIL